MIKPINSTTADIFMELNLLKNPYYNWKLFIHFDI